MLNTSKSTCNSAVLTLTHTEHKINNNGDNGPAKQVPKVVGGEKLLFNKINNGVIFNGSVRKLRATITAL